MSNNYPNPELQKRNSFDEDEDYDGPNGIRMTPEIEARLKASADELDAFINKGSALKTSPVKESKKVKNAPKAAETSEEASSEKIRQSAQNEIDKQVRAHYSTLKQKYSAPLRKRYPHINMLFETFEKDMRKQRIRVGSQGFVDALEKGFHGIKWNYPIHYQSDTAIQKTVVKPASKEVNADNTKITSSVGAGGENLKADVLSIQKALLDLGLLSASDFDKESNDVATSITKAVEPEKLQKTTEAIVVFQEQVLHWDNADGNISGPNSPTLKNIHTESMDADFVQKRLAQFSSIKAKRDLVAEAQVESKKMAKIESANNVVADIDVELARDLAEELYKAIEGFGTDEDAIHHILNYGSLLLQQVVSIYNASFNTISGKGLVQDIINDTSGSCQELMLYQLKRAGVAIPNIKGKAIEIQKGGISTSQDKPKLGDKVTYSAPDGYDSYDWYVLNDPNAREIRLKNKSWYKKSAPIFEAGSGQEFTGAWDYPGQHTVTCRVTTKSGKVKFLEIKAVVGSVADEIPAEHASYEIMAHHMAYLTKGELAKKSANLTLLEQWGYKLDKINEYKGKFGFFAMVFLPEKDDGSPPVVAFRGTEGLADIATDLDNKGPGFNQYYLNKKLIATIFSNLSSKAVATGHSLGGALAQYATVDFANAIKETITFQSPAVDPLTALRFKTVDENIRPEVTHHLANNDVVDLSGVQHLDGSFFIHHLENYLNPLAAHGAFMFTAPNFNEHKDEMGITEEYYINEVKKEVFKENFFVEMYEKHPNIFKRALVETTRKLIPSL